MKDRLKQIMATVFEVPVEQVTDDCSPETIKEWDSLKYMNLVLTLEQEFSVQFTDEQMASMMDFQRIVSALEEQGVA